MIRSLLFIALLAPQLVVAQRSTDSLALPETDEGLPGEGPIRRYDWFRNLWLKRRTAFAEQAPQQENAVVFLGDSITQGWKDDFSGDFPDITTANRGISGDTTRGMLVRLNEDVLSLDPSGVVMLMGTNDLEEGASPETIAANIGRILDAIEADQPGTPVVLNLVMPSDETKKRPASKIKRVNELLLDLAETRPQVNVLDTWSLFAGPDGDATADLFPDLLHPNRAGYEQWRDALRPALETLGLAPVATDDFEAEAGFRSLFNGEDLTGWGFRKTSAADQKKRDRLAKMKNPWAVWPEVKEDMSFEGKSQSPDGRFVAKDGRLIVRNVPEHRRVQQLWTTEKFGTDFELRLQFRASPNADSGVFIRQPQLQCRDYTTAGPFKELKKFRPLDWNDLTVTVKGETATATCNGEQLPVKIELPATGPIGLEGDRGRMEYRRIRIKTAGAQETASNSPDRPEINVEVKASVSDPRTGLVFPNELGPLEYVNHHVFEQAGLGYSVRYSDGDDMKTDVYVYDSGEETVEEGHDTVAVLRQIEDAETAIRYHVRAGNYRDVENLSNEVFPFDAKEGGLQWRFARFSLRAANRDGSFAEPSVSETFLRGYRDHFVKVRITYPAATIEESVKERNKFMADLANLLQTAPAPKQPAEEP